MFIYYESMMQKSYMDCLLVFEKSSQSKLNYIQPDESTNELDSMHTVNMFVSVISTFKNHLKKEACFSSKQWYLIYICSERSLKLLDSVQTISFKQGFYDFGFDRALMISQERVCYTLSWKQHDNLKKMFKKIKYSLKFNINCTS